MSQPEKLNLWDRFFNRYRKVIVEEGTEDWVRTKWFKSWDGLRKIETPISRTFVKYKIIDRLTGSEEIELEYLN